MLVKYTFYTRLSRILQSSATKFPKKKSTAPLIKTRKKVPSLTGGSCYCLGGSKILRKNSGDHSFCQILGSSDLGKGHNLSARGGLKNIFGGRKKFDPP